jgi:flavorubredoxin
MKPREIRPGVEFVGAVDWNRRLFDALIPTPDGTSYNAYLVRGSEKTALIDAVEPAMLDVLLDYLHTVDRIDYIVSQHAEQDHSGTIPTLLEKHPESVVLCSGKASSLLIDHLGIPAERIRSVEDGESVSLGDKTLQFVTTPWVHWPETICTYLPEDRILFSCDFLGSHYAQSDLYAGDSPLVIDAAKRYYAELMMPFRLIVAKNLQKLRGLEFDLLAPSHGPIYDQPETILSAYEDWTSDRLANVVVMPYVTMHGSTEEMVQYLLAALVEKGITVQLFELTTMDLGKLAMALVDAATLVIATPTMNAGPHPAALSAAVLVNAVRPKLKYSAIIGSYGWGTKVVEQLAAAMPAVRTESLGTVLCRGLPRAETYAALDALADAIAERHAAL